MDERLVNELFISWFPCSQIWLSGTLNEATAWNTIIPCQSALLLRQLPANDPKKAMRWSKCFVPRARVSFIFKPVFKWAFDTSTFTTTITNNNEMISVWKKCNLFWKGKVYILEKENHFCPEAYLLTISQRWGGEHRKNLLDSRN